MTGIISCDSPVGRLSVVADRDAITGIRWGDNRHDEPTPLLVEALRQLQAYFDGKLTRFDLPLAPEGTPFEQRVWAAMRQIPHGQTRSYGDLAHEVGSAPRAIGRACGRNPIPIVIPCHRVLGRNGLGGYSGEGGLGTKTRLLALEGALQEAP